MAMVMAVVVTQISKQKNAIHNHASVERIIIDVIPPTSEKRNAAATTAEIAVPKMARLAANVKNLRLLSARLGSAAFMRRRRPNERLGLVPAALAIILSFQILLDTTLMEF